MEGDLDLRRLGYFVAVAEEGSFQGAAKTLHIAQSALSRRVHELEDEVGSPLFLRLPRGAQLLPAGEILLEHARLILGNVADAKAHLARYLMGRSGTIRIGMTGLAGQLRFIGDAFAAFGKVAADVEVVVKIVTSRGEVLNLLRSGQIDVALVQGNVSEQGLVSQRIRSFDGLVAMPVGHPLSSGAEVDVKQFAEYPILSFSRELDSVAFDRIVSACVAVGIRPQIVQQIPLEPVRLALVAAGMGISVVSSSIHERPYPAGLYFRPLVGIDFDAGLDLAWRNASDGPALQLLATSLIDAAHAAECAAAQA